MLVATLKSLLSRKLRLVLSGFAVILGVMAVSAALVLSDTLNNSFDSLFRSANQNIDVQVTGKPNVEVSGEEGEAAPEPIPANVVDELKSSVTDADSIRGVVAVDGARVVKKDGKIYSTGGAPRFGVNWDGEDDYATIVDGEAPTEPNQIAINRGLAEAIDAKVGDTLQIITLHESAQEFELSGIFNVSGDRPSLGGETMIAFTTPVAQQLMLGKEGHYSAIQMEAKDGVSQQELKDTVKSALGSDADKYDVKTGKEVQEDNASDVSSFIGIFRNVLLGFAAVTLFVGIFLIINTFSILIAQRTKELALFRAMGAGRGQVIGSVLLEALVIGIIASTAGLFAGIGIAWLLKKLMEAQSGATLPGAAIVVPPSAIIASYAVGILVTLIASVVPALRAARIPPIAAMRDAAATSKPISKVSVGIGLAIALAGVVALGFALTGNASAWVLLIGVLGVFIGIAVLAPVIAAPAVSALGLAFRSMPGKLGRRNSARNPRRTAITAATLMIGLALVTGASVVGDSFKGTINKQLSDDFGAQIFIIGDFTDSFASYDPAIIDEVRKIEGVEAASPFWFDVAEVRGKNEGVFAADLDQMAKMVDIDEVEGEVRSLKSGELLIDDETADDWGAKVGETIPVTTQRGGPTEMTLVGIYKKSDLMSGVMLSEEDAVAGFKNPQAQQGYVRVTEGTSVGKVRRQIDTLLADNPEVSAQDKQALMDAANQQINGVLTMIYVLLGLALIVAVLGIINTLALSVLERTRELGLLRAIGMTRLQSMRMITVESIVISVFGALLGLAVGCALGAAAVKALESEGIDVLSFPWIRMLWFLVAAIVVGVIAAIIPAIKAARTNVLKAISYE